MKNILMSLRAFFSSAYERVRARDSKGRYVADDPNILFAMQADGAVVDDDLGANAALVNPLSNTTFGMSRAAIDISTTNTTNTLPIRIVDFLGGHDGDERGTSFPIMLCKFNVGHLLTNTTAVGGG